MMIFISQALAAQHTFDVLEMGTGISLPCEIQVGDQVYFSEDGHFDLELNEYDVIVVVSPLHQEIEIPAAKIPSKIWLKAQLPPHEIIVESEVFSEHPSRQILDEERVRKTPGSYSDPMRLLQSLAGVGVTREYSPSAGLVVLRSASPQESRVLVDGIDVPYLYHFKQYASIIHTRSLSSLNLYSSGFSEVFGQAIGGVVDLKTKTPASEAIRWSSDINFIMAGTYAELPLKRSHLFVSARRSHADLIDKDNDQYSLWPRFWDYYARHAFDVSEDLDIGFSVLGAGDKYARLVADTERINPYEQSINPNFVFDRQFHTVAGHLNYSGQSFSTSSVLAFVDHTWNGELPSARQNQKDRYLWFRAPMYFIANDLISIAFGTETKLGTTSLFSTANEPEFLLSSEAPLLALGTPLDQEIELRQLGVWGSCRWNLDALYISTGFRGDSTAQQGWYGLDPRVSFQWQLGNYGLRGGWGKYSQGAPVEMLAIWETLPISRSEHGLVGVNTTVANRWELELNGWYRSSENMIRAGGKGEVFIHDGMAYGGELISRYRIKERFFSWASLALGKAIESQDQNSGLSTFNQPLVFNFVASWQPRMDLEVSSRYRYASGTRYFDPVGSVYLGTTDSYQPVYEQFSNAQLPQYQKLDLHFGKHWWTARAQMTAYVELWWVPNAANVLYPTYNFDYTEKSLVVGPPIFPLAGFRIEN